MNLQTYNWVVSAVQYPAGVGTLVRGVEGAGVGTAALEANREKIPLTVVRGTVVDDLEWWEQKRRM